MATDHLKALNLMLLYSVAHETDDADEFIISMDITAGYVTDSENTSFVIRLPSFLRRRRKSETPFGSVQHLKDPFT